MYSCSLVLLQTLATVWALVIMNQTSIQALFIQKIEIGIYHSGIEIGEHEYCFGGHDYEHVTGVFMVQPKIGPQGLLFK